MNCVCEPLYQTSVFFSLILLFHSTTRRSHCNQRHNQHHQRRTTCNLHGLVAAVPVSAEGDDADTVAAAEVAHHGGLEGLGRVRRRVVEWGAAADDMEGAVYCGAIDI